MSKKIFIGLVTMILFMVSALATITTIQSSAADSGLVVAIDMGHGGYHATDVKNFLGNLTTWGYTAKNITTTFTADSLSGVDVLITFPPDVNHTFSTAEKTAVADWFNSGNKGLWATGDSDFSDPEGKVAAGLNAILEAVNSQVLTEQGSIESDLQAGTNAPYRVRAPIYNSNELYVTNNFLSGATNHEMFIHGPTSLIGVKDSSYVAIEGNEAYFQDHNVFWIARCVNNATYHSTETRASADGLKYQVHEDSSQSDFIGFTVERFAGTAKTSKIVVTSEAIMSDYKSMFNNWDEKLNPQDNHDLVKNTLAWFAVNETPSTTNPSTGSHSSGTVSLNNIKLSPGLEHDSVIIFFLVITPVVLLKRKRLL